jgi:putative ABC transport system permease protein
VIEAKYIARRMRRYPYATLSIILVFGLGVGLASAGLELVYAFFYRPLPVQAPNELVRFVLIGAYGTSDLSYPIYSALKGAQGAFTDVLGWTDQKLPIREGNIVNEQQVGFLTGNTLKLLGIQPVLGRSFLPEEDRAGGSAYGWTCILSYSYWQSHYHGKKTVLDETIVLANVPVRVIGVLPKEFLGIVRSQSPAIYCPLHILTAIKGNERTFQSADSSWLMTVARLKPGVSFLEAQADANRIKSQVVKQVIHDANSDELQKSTLAIEDFSRGGHDLVEMYRQPLKVLAVLCLLILVLCCANVSALCAIKVASELHDIAVCIALGARPRELLRRLLLELSVLCICGSVVAAFFSVNLTRIVVATLSTAEYPVVLDLSVNATHVGLYLLAVSAVIILIGATPVWLGLGPDTVEVLKREGGAGHTGRLAMVISSWLIPIQIAMSLVLVFAAVLLGNSLHRLIPARLGFNESGLVRIGTDFSHNSTSGQARLLTYERVLEDLVIHRKVQSATIEQVPMLSDVIQTGSFTTFGSSGIPHQNDRVRRNVVGPHFFETMGTSLLRGREFNSGDGPSQTSSCVINQSAGDYFFPDGDSLGKWLHRSEGQSGATPVCQVIGIVEDLPYTTLRRPHELIVYTAMWQDPDISKNNSPTFLVRTNNLPFTAKDFSTVLTSDAAGASMLAPITIHQLISESTRQERLMSWMSGVLSAASMFLLCAGMYALLSDLLVLRRREIGIRTALGASRTTVVYETFRRVLKLVTAGVLFGALLGILVSRFLTHLLFGTNSLNPLLLGGSILLLVVFLSLAATVPVLRAARLNPVDALRWE